MNRVGSYFWQKMLDWLSWTTGKVTLPLERKWGSPKLAYHCGVSHGMGLCVGAYLTYTLASNLLLDYLTGYIAALLVGMVFLVFSRIFYGKRGVKAFHWGFWLGVIWPPTLFLPLSLVLEAERAYDFVTGFTLLCLVLWILFLFHYFLTRVRQTLAS